MSAVAAMLSVVAALLVAGCSGGAQDDGSGDDGAAATRLAVIGDFGTGGPPMYEVAELLEQAHAEQPWDGVVTTGDNVYPDGDPEDFDRSWTYPYGWVDEADLPVAASLGNHDVGAGEEQALMDLLGMPDRWYATTIGALELVVLDSNTVQDPKQTAFLRDALAQPLPEGAVYRVVVFHEPPLSCAESGPNADVREQWLPLLRDADVDLVLNGHAHNYQRFVDDGTAYVVTGGGGANLYPTVQCPEGVPEPEAAEVEFHAVELTADDELRVRAITPGGDVLDDAVVATR